MQTIIDKNNTKECIGICPYCKSEDLDYQDGYPEDDWYIYNFICLECNQEGKEVYRLIYLQTEYKDKDYYIKTTSYGREANPKK